MYNVIFYLIKAKLKYLNKFYKSNKVTYEIIISKNCSFIINLLKIFSVNMTSVLLRNMWSAYLWLKDKKLFVNDIKIKLFFSKISLSKFQMNEKMLFVS